MEVRQTSLEAYEHIKPTLSLRQQEVLEVINRGPITSFDTAKALSLPINCVTGRIKELNDYGLVTDHSKVTDKNTGCKRTLWTTKRM